jgi:DMSO/TMAO reductase YedYZ molybdopterin-dependent catalytic subunit
MLTFKRTKLIPGVDRQLLVRDATKLMPDLTRRRFIAGGASLGALTLLTGCDVSDSASAESLLTKISKFNDAVQAAIFNPNTLAPTFSESAITRPFPFNAYYGLDDAPNIDGKDWKLEVRGLVENKKSWTLDELYQLPQEKQITRHICVEGWSAIGSWTGTPLRHFLKLIGADTRAKYCWFQCADMDGYNSPLDMETALHPQTIMAFKFDDKVLPRAYGFPMKIRVPTKLGFKNPKYVVSMEVTNDYKGGYWEDQGYNSFSGS